MKKMLPLNALTDLFPEQKYAAELKPKTEDLLGNV